MNKPLLIAGIAIVGFSLIARAVQAKNVLKEEEEDDDVQKEVYLNPPSGFRRAKQTDVTPDMTAQAKASLSNEMGSLLGPYTNANGQQYYIAIETHSNKPKGASVFIQE